MPVTFAVADHAAATFSSKWQVPSNDPDKILASIKTSHKPVKLLQSSVDGTKDIIRMENGFVQGVLLAYNQHHNLVIRPDDVWVAILSQLNFYINAHAEELRDKFVAHSGKKTLTVLSNSNTVEGTHFGEMAVQLSGKIHENVTDQSLIPWVLPNFSTTTLNDTVISSILIMSTLKSYFDYRVMIMCGIPSITLEGTQADWQSIHDRIDKISEFGAEPTEWASMLHAIIARFVHAFDVGGPQADKEFWERCIHHESGGSGPDYISGWMTAFCAWDPEGFMFKSKEDQGYRQRGIPDWVYDLTIDGACFPRVHSPPEGYAEVDVKVVNGSGNELFDCAMVAGHVGISMESKEKLDTVHIAPQWFMYVKGEERQLGTRW
ncbi:hypothetical protein FPV67DRAFT_892725 [Lyophyllum atratum]|nr:hypothetical protein FPV67DRAFT_892725 [Lyophyllum atratum]